MLILGGSIDTQLGKDPQQTLEGSPLTMLILGGVNRHSTWKGSAETLEGLPLTMLILGEGGRLTLNLERIRKDFGRIASDNVDPGGLINTQLGKDLQRLWKDCL